MKRAHVIYSGRVQGVGFRWTTQRISRDFAVAGYVKNLRDGTVELAAEGEEQVVQGFLGAISRELGPNITEADVHWSEASGEFRTFDIAR